VTHAESFERASWASDNLFHEFLELSLARSGAARCLLHETVSDESLATRNISAYPSPPKLIRIDKRNSLGKNLHCVERSIFEYSRFLVSAGEIHVTLLLQEVALGYPTDRHKIQPTGKQRGSFIDLTNKSLPL
jgi:hypothetical protein